MGVNIFQWKYINISAIILCAVIVFFYKTLSQMKYTENYNSLPNRQIDSVPNGQNSLLARQTFEQENVNKTIIFKNSAIVLKQTIKDIRYTNCLSNGSVYIRQACIEEKSVSSPRKNDWKRRLPGCIIIGTFKSGTRELIDFLAMNPWIVIRQKPSYELAFFDKNAGKGLEWYRNQMPPSVPGQITIEKSPSYFSSELAPERIHAMNSSIKLILLVRDPVDRALSQFNFDMNGNRKYGGSLYNCAMNLKTNMINKNCKYVMFSTYDSPMARYLTYFNRSQILIIDALEYRNYPFKILQKVENFLSIPHLINSENFVYNSDRDIFCLRSIRAKGVCYGITRGRPSYIKTLQPEFREQLRSWFKPHNDEFVRLSQQNFSWS